MKINFRQGLVSSEIDATNQPSYLVTNSMGISLRATNRPIIFTLAEETKNYTLQITEDVLAWPNHLTDGVTEAWLYIDVNRATSARTYGLTLNAPYYGVTAPSAPIVGQHWFDTRHNVMKVFAATGTWQRVVRIFAGHFTNTKITPMHIGTQISINGNFTSGTIVTDGFGHAVTDSKGLFLTTEDVVMIDGAESYAAKLETNVIVAPAKVNIPAYHVVVYDENGELHLADYDDVGNKIIGLATVNAIRGEPVNIVMQGRVHNPLWDWGKANVTLWVDQNGELVDIDPYMVGGRVKRRVPVARSIDPQTVLFDQGLGGVGEKGDAGDVTGVYKASRTVHGIAKLSVSAVDHDDPIVVGDNDPRLTDQRAPLYHTHPASEVSVTNLPIENPNAQAALEYLNADKLSKTGGTVTGPVISNVPEGDNENQLLSFKQAREEIDKKAVTFKRVVMDENAPDVVLAFNSLSTESRTLTVNQVLIVEYQSDVFIWGGGFGEGVAADNESQFHLVGKLAAEATQNLTIRSINAVTAFKPAGCLFTSDYSTGSMNFGIRNGKAVADMDGMVVDVIFAEGELYTDLLGIGEVGSLTTDRPEKLGEDGLIILMEDSGMYILQCLISMSEDMSGYESVLTIGELEIPFQFSSTALQAFTFITSEQRDALIGMDELCISVDEPTSVVEPVDFVIKTTDGDVLEIGGPGEVPGTDIYVFPSGYIEGSQLEEVVSWPEEKPDWFGRNNISFGGANLLTKVPDTLPAWITDTSNMFNGCSNFNQDLSSWNTSNVTNMSSMFFGCSSFNQDISGWDTSNVTDMGYVFNNCSNFNQDLSSWNTSNVTNMSNMFYQCSNFNQDLSGWDTSSATDMEYMFYRCSSFDQDISGWDTNNVTNMFSMFYECSSFNQDISSWDTSNVTDMSYVFRGCSSFNRDLSSWDTSNVTTMSNMFRECSNFNRDLSGWNTSNVTDMSFMFYYCSSFNGDISGWDTSSVTDMSSMFRGCSSFNRDLSSWDTSNVTTMSNMLGYCSNFNQDLSSWDTSNVTDMSYVFNECSDFNGDLSGWDTSNVTNMLDMFYQCSNFNQDLSSWDTSNVTIMRNMFYGCSSFNQDLSGWCVSNFSSEPDSFSANTTSWTLPKPIWGTCP